MKTVIFAVLSETISLANTFDSPIFNDLNQLDELNEILNKEEDVTVICSGYDLLINWVPTQIFHSVFTKQFNHNHKAVELIKSRLPNINW